MPKSLFEEVDAELSAPRKAKLRSLKIKLVLLLLAVAVFIVAAGAFGAWLAT